MNLIESLHKLFESTGLYNFSLGQGLMILVGLTLIYLGISKEFEPLLMLPIGFGGILANIPVAEISKLSTVTIADGSVLTILGGFLGQIYGFGVESGLFPLLIFLLP